LFIRNEPPRDRPQASDPGILRPGRGGVKNKGLEVRGWRLEVRDWGLGPGLGITDTF